MRSPSLNGGGLLNVCQRADNSSVTRAYRKATQTTAGYTRTTKEQLRAVSDALDFG